MRYLMSVLDSTTGSATPEEMAAIDAFNDQLVRDGRWVLAGGLAAPPQSLVVDGRGAAATVSDGPFTESAEYVAGLWVVDAADEQEARRLAVEASRACARRVELRPFLG